MARKRSKLAPNAGISPEIVAELRGLCSSFAQILDHTQVPAREMRGDLSRVLDLYISLNYLTSELELKTDRHLGGLWLPPEQAS